MIIAFTGKKYSGKDTCSDILVSKYGFIKKSFAEPVKKACKNIFLLTENQVNGTEKEVLDGRWGCSPRVIMQKVATELFRDELKKHINIPESIWIYGMRLFLQQNKDKNIVISDLRFPDEAKMIKEFGGVIISLHRNNDNQPDNHPSENYNILGDYCIDNNGDVDTLKENLKTILLTLNI